ncbi:MFS transporter [Treponema sp. OMZ 840]|uniref:MFS transporter n=1 Tax=Treponema sp. OMZ 840 TaxID=244313 RepID=UPI003D8C6DDD
MDTEKKVKSDGFKKYLPVTFLIGAGFFTMGLMDPLYDSYVTIFLSRYIPFKWLVGMFMSLDNVFAIFLIPVISALSDKTRTKIGRRMPWIIVLLPLSALAFSFIPYAAQRSLAALVIILALLNLFKQSVRGPVIALMPDIVPAEFRSQGNGVINTMGNIAAIVGTLFLARLMDVDTVLPIIGKTKDVLAFPAAGVLVLAATLMLALFVRENRKGSALDMLSESPESEKEKKVPFLQAMKTVLAGTKLDSSETDAAAKKDRSALLVLCSLFLWFMGYQGMLPYIAEYSIKTFGVTSGQAPFAAGMVGIASALSAIPMGYAAGKWGRRRMIRIALVAVASLCVCQFFLSDITALLGIGGESAKYVFWVLMFLFGIFWICIIANSFPMLWQMAGFSHIGLYTGLYYTFSQASAIIAPFCAGLIIDLLGYKTVFLYCALFFLFAFMTMGRVKRGEKTDS